MKDLFTTACPRTAVHLKTNTLLLVTCRSWYKGEVIYDCLVPQADEKGNTVMCNATYSENEITFKEPERN